MNEKYKFLATGRITPRNGFKQLPPAIVCPIFRYLYLPSLFLDSSLTRGPWCRSLRTKLLIVGTCKTWWQIGSGILYEVCFVFIPHFLTHHAHMHSRRWSSAASVKYQHSSTPLRLPGPISGILSEALWSTVSYALLLETSS